MYKQCHQWLRAGTCCGRSHQKERPVCTVVLNGLCINNAIIGSELEHAVGGAIRREAGMYSCME